MHQVGLNIAIWWGWFIWSCPGLLLVTVGWLTHRPLYERVARSRLKRRVRAIQRITYHGMRTWRGECVVNAVGDPAHLCDDFQGPSTLVILELIPGMFLLVCNRCHRVSVVAAIHEGDGLQQRLRVDLGSVSRLSTGVNRVHLDVLRQIDSLPENWALTVARRSGLGTTNVTIVGPWDIDNQCYTAIPAEPSVEEVSVAQVEAMTAVTESVRRRRLDL